MNYHLKSRPQKNSLKRFFFIVFVAIIVTSIIVPGSLFIVGVSFADKTIGFKNKIVVGYDIVSSYFYGQTKLSLKNRQLQSIANEIVGYRTENTFLRNEIKKLKSISIENNSIIADVVSVPPQTPYSMMIISNVPDGRENNLVLSDSNIAIGTISEQMSSYAKVNLFSRGGNSVTVQNHRTGEHITINGTGAGNFFANLPKDSDVVAGDIFVINTNEQYVVAKVEQLEIRENSPFLNVYAITPISIFAMQHVLVNNQKINEFEE